MNMLYVVSPSSQPQGLFMLILQGSCNEVNWPSSGNEEAMKVKPLSHGLAAPPHTTLWSVLHYWTNKIISTQLYLYMVWKLMSVPHNALVTRHPNM